MKDRLGLLEKSCFGVRRLDAALISARLDAPRDGPSQTSALIKRRQAGALQSANGAKCKTFARGNA
jgi:hypothetical protein